MDSKTFVLVHGAWHGGWCWRRVSDRLRQQGHIVFTPTLTGLGERVHLFGPGIGLATHITDIVNVFTYERLTDVVLCGHSYGGMVISGVAEQLPDAIRSIVFLDAFMPEDGDSIVDLAVPAVAQAIRQTAERGEIAVPIRPAASFGVNEIDQAWVDSLLGPQPLAAFTETVALTGKRERIARKTYIRAAAYGNPVFEKTLERCTADPTWHTYSVPCGHDVMVDMPERLVEILLDVA